MDTKTCKECGREFVLDRKKGHRGDRCNSCCVTVHRKQREERVYAYKGNKCVLCGYDKCRSSLHFHHLNPSEKSFEISGSWGRGWEKMKKELDKCILVCANCHGEIHEGLWQTGNAADF